ncbi:hypothetical protein AYO20_11332 [Fonsecaea nubica]|uniref:ADF-H domain-containing protein n=1 Tax=Fonsecaea nubica TaxID=856822 RepID=A0A178BVM4_9EURO|nr:hypothetical protein AYO20_11332 [Fonsecaea nubica]OAL21660.1 hypothetical protein AYO20_11332 [Fonsecaea nubica]
MYGPEELRGRIKGTRSMGPSRVFYVGPRQAVRESEANCASSLQNHIDQIDTKTQEIKPSSDDTYSDLLELADELPDSSPRFVLLSYPLTLASGRQSVPYVLLYYLPVNCNPNMRMSYAGAVELMRSTAEVNRVLEIADAEDLQDIEGRLKGED